MSNIDIIRRKIWSRYRAIVNDPVLSQFCRVSVFTDDKKVTESKIVEIICNNFAETGDVGTPCKDCPFRGSENCEQELIAFLNSEYDVSNTELSEKIFSFFDK